MRTFTKRLIAAMLSFVLMGLSFSGSVPGIAFVFTANASAAFVGGSIAAGYGHTIALKKDGTVWAWGTNAYGQLGNGTNNDSTKAVQVSGLRDVASVTSGKMFNLALKKDGSVWIWGAYGVGQPDGNQNNTMLTPVPFTELGSVKALAEGNEHTLALKNDGTVWSWGSNSRGQLGNGSKIALAKPALIGGLQDIVAISAGSYHSLALKKDGTIWAWGANGAGQIGTGAYDDVVTPVQVSGITDVAAISAGSFHSLVLKQDGTVWAWGYNAHGELGSGKDDGLPKPTQVAGVSGITEIAAGEFFSMALKNDGTVWTWGFNGYYQLGTGDGKRDNSLKPVQVAGITNAVDVAAGKSHALAILQDGTVSAWGHNGYGQLGDNSVSERNLKVTVKGLTDVSIGGRGDGFAIKVRIDDVLQAYEQPPVLMNGRTMVPLRGIFETLGAKVDWNDAQRAVTATKGSTTVYLKIGDANASVNGVTVSLDQAAVIFNDKTMVPVRFVSEALGGKVDWIPETNTVAILTK